jgi:alkaline phosphatase D
MHCFHRNCLQICVLVFFAATSFSKLSAQAPSIVCEPIFGALTPNSAKVWMMVKDCKTAQLQVADHVYDFTMKDRFAWNGNIPVKFDVQDIPAGGSVDAQLLLDGKPVGSPFAVAAAPLALKDEWSFMLGSCALYGVGASGLIKPGRHTLIFDEMLANPTDLMVWLGDNVYLLNGEWKHNGRMYEKYTKVRLEPHTLAFLRSRPQYAILDDHDYGPNNAEGNFANKGATMACFRDFWPNPYFGAEATGGSYYHFDYQDASFYMLDDRWFRNSVENQQVLGTEQMEWLKKELKASKSTFKFIGLGSQVLNEVNEHETWSRYKERQVLFDFIRTERITGVVFIRCMILPVRRSAASCARRSTSPMMSSTTTSCASPAPRLWSTTMGK